MKKLILVAVILLLVITKVDSHDFKFGDLLSLPPACINGINVQHFSVYVGREYPGKTDAEYQFERLKDRNPLSRLCEFTKLDMQDKPEKNNYLDGYKDKKGKVYVKGTKDQIIERIKEEEKKCKLYGPLHNNCEHLATYVRYGVRVSLQLNQSGEKFCINRKINKKHLRDYVKDISNTPCNSDG